MLRLPRPDAEAHDASCTGPRLPHPEAHQPHDRCSERERVRRENNGPEVNPHGIRVGVIKDWDSRWFASKKDFSDNLVEDHKIRTELKAQLKDAGVPKIEIERTVDPSTSAPRVTVNIYCAKPGMVIGKGGEERVALRTS